MVPETMLQHKYPNLEAQGWKLYMVAEDDDAPLLRRLRQEDCEPETNLGNSKTLFQNNKHQI